MKKSPSISLITVETTIGTAEEARILARKLVSAKLVACVQISPIVSHYVWEGKAGEETEFRLSLKTVEAAFSAIVAFLQLNHPYEVPQIIAQTISLVTNDYRDWVVSAVSLPPSQ